MSLVATPARTRSATSSSPCVEASVFRKCPTNARAAVGVPEGRGGNQTNQPQRAGLERLAQRRPAQAFAADASGVTQRAPAAS